MSILDERIADMATVLDNLLLLRKIVNSGSCNDCGIERVCRVRPTIGEPVRYNCPFWTEMIKELRNDNAAEEKTV